MDRGARWATVHGVAELNTTEQLSTHTHTHTHTLDLHNEEDRLWSHTVWTFFAFFFNVDHFCLY